MESEPTIQNQNAEQTPSHKKNSFWASVREWVKVIIIALVISLPIRFFIAEPFVVKGASMDPTFSTGQFLIVDRLSYRLEQPERYEVIVFKYPNNPRVYYIKRIIGLPGETVTVENGKVTIFNSENPNGLELQEPYVETTHRSSDSLRFTLGEHEYFVMGDNRAESSDSRVWGALDQDYIIGRPLVRLLPISKVNFLPGQYHANN